MANLCAITDEEADPLFDPTTSTTFINANYVVPTNKLASPLSLQIFVGGPNGTAYQFNRHYQSETYQDNLVFAGRSTCSFTIRDNDKDRFNLPFKPTRNQYVLIENGGETLFSGFIANVIPELLSTTARADGTLKRLLHIECQDTWYMLEQDTYSKAYPANSKAGYILKDAVDRAGLDSTLIDVNAGPEFEAFAANEEFPASVIERIRALADWTYWLDVTVYPPKFSYGSIDAELNQVDLQITEKTWTYLFDKDLDLRTDQDGFATKVILESRMKWDKGSADFQQGSNVVLGHTGLEDWFLLNNGDGLEIENLNTGAVYRVQKNNSDANDTNEFILSSDYEEALEDEQPYVVRGPIFKVIRQNDTAIKKLQAIRGGSGILTKVIREEAALSYAEASKMAEAELAIFSKEFFRGSANSDNIRIKKMGIRPGQTFFFNLPQSREVVASVVIQGISRKDIHTRERRADGTTFYCGMACSFDFTPSIYYDREQLRALQRTTRKVPASDKTFILQARLLQSVLAIKTCAHLRPGLRLTSLGDIETGINTESVVFSNNGYYTEKDFTAQVGGYYSFTS